LLFDDIISLLILMKGWMDLLEEAHRVEVVVETFVIPLLQPQQAEAKGYPLISPAANASKTRCVH
jgi:hypothetical protein